MTLVAPHPIDAGHDTSQFACGHASLDEWLQKRALANEVAQVSRTYVIREAARVVGFYTLAMGSVERGASASAAMRRNMPQPVPAVVIGRLAVDSRYQGQSFGAGLLKDAILRSLQASRVVGARLMLGHAIDERAREFYINYSFVESRMEPLTVMLDLSKAATLLAVRRKSSGQIR